MVYAFGVISTFLEYAMSEDNEFALRVILSAEDTARLDRLRDTYGTNKNTIVKALAALELQQSQPCGCVSPLGHNLPRGVEDLGNKETEHAAV